MSDSYAKTLFAINTDNSATFLSGFGLKVSCSFQKLCQFFPLSGVSLPSSKSRLKQFLDLGCFSLAEKKVFSVRFAENASCWCIVVQVEGELTLAKIVKLKPGDFSGFWTNETFVAQVIEVKRTTIRSNEPNSVEVFPSGMRLFGGVSLPVEGREVSNYLGLSDLVCAAIASLAWVF